MWGNGVERREKRENMGEESTK